MVRLSDYRGRKIVLYFYPKDDTPGCTREACAFRDVYDEMLARGVVVIGISKDSPAAHARFKDKYNLPFHLLSDPDGQVIGAYGAWGEKKMMGRTYMGILRCTYLIDEGFLIAKVFPKVKPDEHAGEVLALLST
jgi:peroxiredoxin Q/BCP